MMTVGEAAEFLQVSRSMVYKLVEDGRVPAFRIGRLVRISQRDLMESLRAFAVA